eukprot:NODE_657_length_2003_cov_1335.444729_g608_i0.p1 GENE.NODE_657_length_2003_cov_1335.444729_g608_i0~~NODE_657_length_2003_cov_1335.444729_g608_i0.p1  ORF type:complete len:147 (+),score=5.53 NODE_657_length_2003_cov_1335.444729_g608_i0:983-1423(+)
MQLQDSRDTSAAPPVYTHIPVVGGPLLSAFAFLKLFGLYHQYTLSRSASLSLLIQSNPKINRSALTFTLLFGKEGQGERGDVGLCISQMHHSFSLELELGLCVLFFFALPRHLATVLLGGFFSLSLSKGEGSLTRISHPVGMGIHN